MRSRLGAEGDADRDFLLTIDRAREQQVGDIGARDQEHERDGARQHQQRRPDVLHELILRRASPARGRSCWTRETPPRAAARSVSISTRACSSVTPGFSRAIGKMPGCQPRSSGSVAAHGPNGDVDVRGLKELEARRAGRRPPCRAGCRAAASRPIGVAAGKSPLREARTEDRHALGAGPILAVGEVAPSFDGYAEQRQQCGGDHLCRDPFGIARARHGHARGAKRRHSGERLRPSCASRDSCSASPTGSRTGASAR